MPIPPPFSVQIAWLNEKPAELFEAGTGGTGNILAQSDSRRGKEAIVQRVNAMTLSIAKHYWIANGNWGDEENYVAAHFGFISNRPCGQGA
jgi:hypothetical protein